MSNTMDDPPDKDAGLFGLEFDPEHNEIIIIGVPWEPTVSYGRGTSLTPTAIIQASHQLDFFDLDLKQVFGETIGMVPLNQDWVELNRSCIELANPIIAAGGAISGSLIGDQAEVNWAGQRLNRELEQETAKWLEAGKTVGVLGGDHSSPLGCMKACLSRHPNAGILHIDAHHDLREAYEGFTWSHASIMFNLLNDVPTLPALVSVGIRDFCEAEYLMARDDERIHTFYDQDFKRALFEGTTVGDLCRRMIEPLPEEVYISFDIDGLEPQFCANTGTPVPVNCTAGPTVTLLIVSSATIGGVAPPLRDCTTTVLAPLCKLTAKLR